MQRSSVVVVQGDRVMDVVADGCGPATRFQLASVSKQFTAAVVLRLDDPIGRWISACPPSWGDITLRHLLTHTSGIGHWGDHLIDPAQRLEPGELLETFGRVPPLFTAGTGWRYSSPGYVLLALAAQEAAGEPYRDLLGREIFAPLGMEGTFAGSPGDRPSVARGYDQDGAAVASFELDVVNVGAGDVWSTTTATTPDSGPSSAGCPPGTLGSCCSAIPSRPTWPRSSPCCRPGPGKHRRSALTSAFRDCGLARIPVWRAGAPAWAA